MSHDAREAFTASQPLHVTLKAAEGVGSLRRAAVMEVFRDAIEEGGRRDDFRVEEHNVLRDQVHMIVEADGPQALARGMQGLNVRFARGINGVLGRKGALFAARYQAKVLRSPSDVREARRVVRAADQVRRRSRLPRE